jgi:hypothetical protein
MNMLKDMDLCNTYYYCFYVQVVKEGSRATMSPMSIHIYMKRRVEISNISQVLDT